LPAQRRLPAETPAQRHGAASLYLLGQSPLDAIRTAMVTAIIAALKASQ